MKPRGFYIIADTFFADFPDPYLKGNKSGNRPHYYCLSGQNGLLWFIPTSRKLEKYQDIIRKRTSHGKRTDFLHVAKLDNGKTAAFLIAICFPFWKNTFCASMLFAEITCELQATILLLP